jgi:hypothetical protein
MKARGIPPLGVKNQKNLRTDGRSMKPLNYSKRSHSCTLAGLRQIHFEPTVALRRKSTVCGLNGLLPCLAHSRSDDPTDRQKVLEPCSEAGELLGRKP